MSVSIRESATKVSDETVDKFLKTSSFLKKGTHQQDIKEGIDLVGDRGDIAHSNMSSILSWHSGNFSFDFKTDKKSEMIGGRFYGKICCELLRVTGELGSVYGNQTGFIYYNGGRSIVVSKLFCQQYIYEKYKITAEMVLRLSEIITTQTIARSDIEKRFTSEMSDKEVLMILDGLKERFTLSELRKAVYDKIRYKGYRELLNSHKGTKRIIQSIFTEFSKKVLGISHLNVGNELFQSRFDWGHIDLCVAVDKKDFLQEGIRSGEIVILE